MTPVTRRRWLQSGPLALALGWASPSGAQGPSVRRTPENFRLVGAPVVLGVSSTAASIAWGVNDTSTGWVEYGETDALGRMAAPDGHGLRPLDDVVHRVRLDGLRAGTRYFYRTVTVPIAFLGAYDIRRGRPFESAVGSFVTPDEGAGDRVRAAVINDTHEQPETLAALFRHLDESPDDLLVWNGDMFNDIASTSQMADQLLRPAGVAYASRRPVWFARGNHDVRGPEARALGRFLEAPGGQYYYSFRHGPVAFLVMDTGEDKADDAPVYAGLGTFDAYRSAQAEWLERELRTDRVRSAPFRVVVAHIPLYSTRPTQPHGGADARAKWHDHLARGGVDLLITGHTHRHAWMAPDATRPFGQLTGGGPRAEEATYIRVEADTQRLTARMFRLDGSLISEHPIARRR